MDRLPQWRQGDVVVMPVASMIVGRHDASIDDHISRSALIAAHNEGYRVVLVHGTETGHAHAVYHPDTGIGQSGAPAPAEIYGEEEGFITADDEVTLRHSSYGSIVLRRTPIIYAILRVHEDAPLLHEDHYYTDEFARWHDNEYYTRRGEQVWITAGDYVVLRQKEGAELNKIVVD